MNHFEIIKTSVNHPLFQSLPHSLYEEGSQRFLMGFDPEDKHLVDCYVLLDHERPVGRFAFYLNPQLKYKGEKAACIGSYECIQQADASSQLLEKACLLAKKNDCRFLIGPMEGSTWNHYRFGAQYKNPVFFMEPYHKVYYNDQFQSAGFKQIAEYFSHISQELVHDKELIERVESHYKEKGFRLRDFNMEKARDELQKIAEFCIREFEHNFLYSPIEARDFIKKYEQYLDLFRAGLIQILENPEGEIEALIFAIQDHFNDPKKTIIIKTLVRKKDSTLKGIGTYLVAKIHEISIQRGYNEIIHAMMFKDNASLNTSKKFNGTPYRTYHLYAKAI